MTKKKNNGKLRKKKKRKNRKLLVSAAAFITAAAVVVFCIRYIYCETSCFLLTGIDIEGNSAYSDEYILEKAGIETGEKIFDIDRLEVREKLEEEVYVESVRVVYELPDKILLDITERYNKYQILSDDEYVIIDKKGVVLANNTEKLDLITIESYTNIGYNIGEIIQFEGIEDVEKVFDAVEYLIDGYGSDTITSFKLEKNNCLVFETHYGTTVKIDLAEDVNYQIVFAMKIINERLNNNLTVASGLIDFAKGDSPVYIEDFKMEDI